MNSSRKQNDIPAIRSGVAQSLQAKYFRLQLTQFETLSGILSGGQIAFALQASFVIASSATPSDKAKRDTTTFAVGQIVFRAVILMMQRML
jgi:hypothetical protein